MCKCFSKCVLITVNVIFLIMGLAITALGIWVAVSRNTMFDLVNLLTKDVNVDNATLNNYMSSTSTLLAAAYVAIAFGGLSIIVGFCGCCGAIRESKCLLIIYAVFVSIILLAEIAAAIAAAVFKGQLDAELKPRLETLVAKHFLPLNQTVYTQSTDATITTYINYAQVLLGCCGVTNQSDITASTTEWSKANATYNGVRQVVPITCCRMNSNRDTLLSNQDWKNVENYLEDKNCPVTGSNAYTTGCYTKVEEHINTYSLPIIIVLVLVGVFEIACVIMAACVIHKRKDDGYHV